MDPTNLGERENWYGGHYELIMDLGPRDDARLRRAMAALWSFPELEGAWLPARGSREATWIGPSLDELHPRLWGRADLPEGKCVCASFVIRFDAGTDWLVFALPVGALSRLDRRVGGYPFGDVEDSLEWRGPIDDWLGRLAEHVFDRVPFPGGLIGMELDDEPVHAVEDVPIERWRGYLVREGDELTYFPATH